MPSSNPFTHLRRKASVDHVVLPADAGDPRTTLASPSRPRPRLPNGRKSSSETFRLLPSPSSEAQASRRRERTQSSAAGASSPSQHSRRRSTSPVSSFYAGPSLGRTATNDSHSSSGSLETHDVYARSSTRDSIGSFFHPGRKRTIAPTPATTSALPSRLPRAARSPPPPPTRPVSSPPFNEEHSPSSRSTIPVFYPPAHAVAANHARAISDVSSVLPTLPPFPSPPSLGSLPDSPILATQALASALDSSSSPAASPREPPSDRLLDEAIEEPRPLQLWEDEDDQLPITTTSDPKEFADVLLQMVTFAEEVTQAPSPSSPHSPQPARTGLDAVVDDASSLVSSGGSARSSSVASPEHLEKLLPCVVEHDDEGVPGLLLDSLASLAPSRASSRLEMLDELASVKEEAAPLIDSTPVATATLDLDNDDADPSVDTTPDDKQANGDMSHQPEPASSIDSPPLQATAPVGSDDLGDRSRDSAAVGELIPNEPVATPLPLALSSADETSAQVFRARSPNVALLAPTEELTTLVITRAEATPVPESLPNSAAVTANPLSESRSSTALTPRLSVSLSLVTAVAAALVATRSTHRRALVALACVSANSGLLLARLLLQTNMLDGTTLLGRGLAAVGLGARWSSTTGRPVGV